MASVGDTVFYWDVEKKNKPMDVSWDISKAPIDFKNSKLDIGD